MNNKINEILSELNRLQEAYEKAHTVCDAMLLFETYNNAAQLKSNLILAHDLGLCEDVANHIVVCNTICSKCNESLANLANKAVQDAIMGKLRELVIRNNH